jgi:anti-anti-sigma factor
MAVSPDCVIQLEGEWDIARRDELDARVEEALAGCDPATAVVVDLRTATFIDSSALSALVNLYNRLRAEDRRLITLCAASGPVRRTIELLELGERLGVLDSGPTDEDDAVA